MFQAPVPKMGPGKRSGTGLKEWEWTHVSFCPFLPSCLSLIFFLLLVYFEWYCKQKYCVASCMYKTEIQNRAPEWRCIFGTHTQKHKGIQQTRIRVSQQILTIPTHNNARTPPFRSHSLIWFEIPPALSVFVGKIMVSSTALSLFLPLSASHCLLPRNKLQIIFLYQETHFWKKN